MYKPLSKNTIELILHKYIIDKLSPKSIALDLKIDRSTVYYHLIKNNIKTDRKRRIPFRQEERDQRSRSSKGRSVSEELKRIRTFNVLKKEKNTLIDYKCLDRFKDLNKLQFLIDERRRLWPEMLDINYFLQFLDKFYFDKNYNNLYDLWINNNKNPNYKPSLDHIIPRSRGGKNNIENLRFISWFENRLKFDMTTDEWEIFKKETNTLSEIFICHQ